MERYQLNNVFEKNGMNLNQEKRSGEESLGMPAEITEEGQHKQCLEGTGCNTAGHRLASWL